tara:strand:+ start:2562 stop:3368 length:807 start_codon:yes stop_codon:yes gene_type:complete
MNIKSSIINNALIESIKMSLLISSKNRILKNSNNKLYFNWGILWEHLSPLILIAGFAFLLSAGLRGRGGGFTLEIMTFLFLFWFGLTMSVQKIANLNIPIFQISKKALAPWTVIYGEAIILWVALFIRFTICLYFMSLLNYNIELYNLLIAYICICLLGFSYGILFSAIFHNNKFITELHSFFLQSLFFTSSIIIPVTALPDSLRNILLYNPLVHFFEWIKSSYTGVTYDYIDFNYFLYFLALFVFLSPISLYIKNNLIKYNKIFRPN